MPLTGCVALLLQCWSCMLCSIKIISTSWLCFCKHTTLMYLNVCNYQNVTKLQCFFYTYICPLKTETYFPPTQLLALCFSRIGGVAFMKCFKSMLLLIIYKQLMIIITATDTVFNTEVCQSVLKSLYLFSAVEHFSGHHPENKPLVSECADLDAMNLVICKGTGDTISAE